MASPPQVFASPTVEKTVHMTYSMRCMRYLFQCMSLWELPTSCTVGKLILYPHTKPSLLSTHVMIHESESNCRRFPMIHHVEEKLCTHCTSGQNMQNAWGAQLQWTSRSRMAPMVPLHHGPCGSCWNDLPIIHITSYLNLFQGFLGDLNGLVRSTSKRLQTIGFFLGLAEDASFYIFFLILCESNFLLTYHGLYGNNDLGTIPTQTLIYSFLVWRSAVWPNRFPFFPFTACSHVEKEAPVGGLYWGCGSFVQLFSDLFSKKMPNCRSSWPGIWTSDSEKSIRKS